MPDLTFHPFLKKGRGKITEYRNVILKKSPQSHGVHKEGSGKKVGYRNMI
jgi:hypothetical protein